MTTPATPDMPPATPAEAAPAPTRRAGAPRWMTFYGGWLTVVVAIVFGVFSLFRRPFDWTMPARALFLISLGVGLIAQGRDGRDGRDGTGA